ncbi:hypothetical protein Tco_0970534 [Tanacetum coccineum]
MPTEMELTLEQTQQGVSYEVSVDPHRFEDHPWIQNAKKAPNVSLGENVKGRLKQFSFMNKLKKLALRVIAESLSDVEVEGIRKGFDLMDTKKQSKINIAELTAGLLPNFEKVQAASLKPNLCCIQPPSLVTLLRGYIMDDLVQDFFIRPEGNTFDLDVYDERNFKGGVIFEHQEFSKAKLIKDNTNEKDSNFGLNFKDYTNMEAHTFKENIFKNESPLALYQLKEQNDQNVVACDDERGWLANLIANLNLDVDENKKIQKQLKKANASLTQELTECKSILAETSRTLGESNSIRDSCLVALQNKQTEFERYKDFNDRTIDYDKLERKLNETLGLLAQKDIDIKEGDLYKLLLVQTMAASAIAISFDSLDESVGSPPSWVILFGDIPTIIPSTSVIAPETPAIAPVISSAALMVETTLVASPIGLCGLVPYSDSDSDSPDEMDSPEYITPLPATSPFLFTDSPKASDSSDGPPSQDPYVATVARWRSKEAARSSLPSDYPIAPITAPPGTRRPAAILIRLGEAIPFGQPYRTHPDGPRKVMTARKRVGPLLARKLALRHVSPRSSDHRPSSFSSSSDSSPVHSSGLDSPDQAHSGPSTRVVSPRLGYLPRRAPRHSKAFHRWCAAPLSTWYPPTTSESSSGDSSERPLHSYSHSSGPSRKRCRSPADSVPSSTPVTGSLAPTRADISSPQAEPDMELGTSDRDDVRDHVESDPRDVRDDIEEHEADTSARDTVEVGVDPRSVPVAVEESEEPVGEDSSGSSGTRDGIVRSFEEIPIDLGDVVRDFYHHMSEVRIDRIVGIETVQGRLEADQLAASGDRARMAERIYSLRLEKLKVRAMLDIERDRVTSLRLHMSLSQEEFRAVRRDRDDAQRRLRRMESYLERRFGFRP